MIHESSIESSDFGGNHDLNTQKWWFINALVKLLADAWSMVQSREWMNPESDLNHESLLNFCLEQ